MKLSKIIIIVVRSIIIFSFIVIQITALISLLPISLRLEPGFAIGVFLGFLLQGALLYYLLFKCRYKWIKKIFKNLREPIEEQPTNS